MEEWYSRTLLLIGNEGLNKLKASHVLVAGLGGVGGYAAEQLCRAGIGELTVIDGDVVNPSNRNRQIIALTGNEGEYKTHLFSRRLKDINPGLKLHIINEYLKEDRFEEIMHTPFNYIVDAIDTLTPKVALLTAAINHRIPIVSSMGSGGKMNPELIEINDISKSHHCKFAYIVRKYLHRKGIFSGIKVVYSPEPVSKNAFKEVSGEENKRSMTGTISYMPAIFGCFCASVVIRDIIASESA